jgi:catechol 2,3-dioxygenase-like lactoylglutathione lyase family enzyme
MGVTTVLYVWDLNRMSAFYVGCFGFLPVEQEDDYVVLRLEDWELTLVAVPDTVASQSPLADPPARRERVPVKLGFTVRSIEAVRPVVERLRGATDASSIWEFRSTRRCDATDPEGNVIQLLERTSAPSSA